MDFGGRYAAGFGDNADTCFSGEKAGEEVFGNVYPMSSLRKDFHFQGERF